MQLVFITLDGHQFEVLDGPLFDPDPMIALYLAKRARNGDAAARDVLTAFGVEIEDADGVAYWPMERGKSER